MSKQLRVEEVSAGEVVAALVIGSAGILVLGLQPIVLGELLEAKQVSLEGVGLVAVAEIVALGIGVLLGDLTQPLDRLRGVTAMASVFAIVLNVLSLQVTGDAGFSLVRGAAGLAEGLLVWATTAVIVRSRSPDRVAGIFFVVQTAIQAAVGFVLASAVIPHHGWKGIFGVLAALMFLPLLLAWTMPGTLHPLASSSQRGSQWSRRTVMPLVTVFLQLSTLGSLWAYIEPLGKSAGFEPQGVQTLIAAALGMQIVGGCAGSALVRRLSPWPVLAMGSVVLGAVALLIEWLPMSDARPLFVALCAVFAFTWLFLMPYQTGMAFAADHGGRVACLIPAAQLFGIAFGPLISSFVVDGENAAGVPMVSATFAAAAGVSLLLSLPSRRTVAAPV